MIVVLMISTFLLAGAVADYAEYNNTHMCCNGVTFERDEDSSIDCCGKTTIDTEKESCCGGEAYDYNEKICCGNKVKDVPDNNSTRYSCCYDKEKNSYLPYHFEKEMCCQGNIIELKDSSIGHVCCEGDAHPSDKFDCCDEKLLDTTDGQRCCGNEVTYDSNSKLCVYVYHAHIDNGFYELQNVTNNHTGLCDKEYYDIESHACCSDTIVPKNSSLKDTEYVSCCESATSFTPYNYTSHTCCSSGDLLPIPTNWNWDFQPGCCNEEIYNASNYLCCNDKLFKESEYQGGCCGDQPISNYSTQFCCNNTIYSYNEEEIPGCCNGKMFNYLTGVCCNDTIHQNVGNLTLSCCYDKLFNADEEMCCRNSVLPMGQDEACCYSSRTAYNTSTHLCCGDEPISVEDVEHARCCYHGKKETVYNIQTQRCNNELGVTDFTESDELEEKRNMVESEEDLCRSE